MASKQVGFTLIEIMIVVAIVGVLAVMALPAYQEYIAKARIVEGVTLAQNAKTLVATESHSTAAHARAATMWNERLGGRGVASKYVRSVIIDEVSGEIAVTFDQATVGSIPANAILVYTPYIGELQLEDALLANTSGPLSWGCASTSNVLASARGEPALHLGTLPARFAPNECR